MVLTEHAVRLSCNIKSESSDDELDVKVRQPDCNGNQKQMSGIQVVLDDDNNDDVERLARRKSRLLEPHPTTAGSPSTNGTLNRRRADAAAPRGISQAQIGEHYGNCIRLAAENKITAKNAFNLHLIDYMSDMLKKEDYASFQIASSSLDAGAKIYAGRVDAVHQETYQVLTGLGRSEKPTVNNDDDEHPDAMTDDLDELGVIPRGEHRKKTHLHRDIIQKHSAKIRSKALVAKSDVDPLFQHQTSAYDEGGTGDLRLNQLCTLTETCVLVLDSSTAVLPPSVPVQADRVNVTKMVDQVQPITLKAPTQLSFCSTLSTFRFTEWDQNADATALEHLDSASLPANEDLDEGPLPMDGDMEADHYSDHDADVQTLRGGLSPIPSVTSPTATTGADIAQADVSRVDGVTNATESELFVSSLKSMLDKQYEHFGQLNDHILGMWAGPEHWRKKAKRRRFDPVTGLEALVNNVEGDGGVETIETVGKSRKTRRTKKAAAPTVDYQAAKEKSENRTRNGHIARKNWTKSELSEVTPNSATIFKENYRMKASRQLNLLPTEWSDTRNTLYQLYNRELVLEANHQLAAASNNSPGNQNGGPNNLPTNENLYAAVTLVDLAQHDMLTDGYAGVESHEPPGSPMGCGDDDDDDDLPLPFDGVFTQATAGHDDFGGFGDLDLISQPRKVARIEIGYARTAKMINVRRLKFAIWNFLESSIPGTNPSRSPLSVASTSSAPDAGSLAPSSNGDHPDGPALSDPVLNGANYPPQPTPPPPTFGELIAALPSQISWQTTKELSVPIVFNCLLHLSNEKELFLSCSDDLTDILISRGIPDTELAPLKTYQTAEQSDPLDPVKHSAKKQRTKKRPHSNALLDSWLADTSPA